MFRQIGSKENVGEFLARCQASKDVRVWGFGHRVFKAYDPRAAILKELLVEFDQKIGLDAATAK